ncbi:MAG: hypothetical protein JST40_08625 [Armatimonadetes bacterium]|nr:hypothetical protein [Armatimonadota bacterium]
MCWQPKSNLSRFIEVISVARKSVGSLSQVPLGVTMKSMRRLPEPYGKFGMGLGVTGVALAWIAHVFSGSPLVMLLLIGVGSSMYLLGGFLMVATYSYHRGSKAMLIMRVLRIALALSVVWGVMRTLGPR